MSRIIELILTATGGAELVSHENGEDRTMWASDTDDEFKEEFPELLDENDVEAVLEWLIEEGHLSEQEADDAEISIEQLEDDAPTPVEGELITADEWEGTEDEDEDEDED